MILDGVIMLLDLWDKIWRNPVWRCKTCAAMGAKYNKIDLQIIQRGFNKYHRHNKYYKQGTMYLRKDKKMTYGTPPATTQGQVGQWYWHVHHEKLVEILTEPIANRIAYIKNYKKDSIDTRLHFMRPVQNIPAEITTINEKITRTRRVYEAVRTAYYNGQADADALNRASKAYTTAQNDSTLNVEKAWEAQHKRECFHYCPWNLGKKTLLPASAFGKK